MSLAAGTRLGAYEIVSALGAGGMGEVYRARDTKLESRRRHQGAARAVRDDPDRLARFEREAQVLASLNHPNIAPIYGFEERRRGSPALVMELVEGATLADRIARAAARSTKRCRSRVRSPRRSRPRTSKASSTAI